MLSRVPSHCVSELKASTMSILQLPLSVPTHPQKLSFSRALSSPHHLFLDSKLSQLSLHIPAKMRPIRMGGGPRTYPGGVSKWQWKRMQAKKAKQLLKARLSRERQIYEMRKRAELRAAVSELERPWEPVTKAPKLFSVSADEQLKVLADRFQKPGGLDLWSERDGPQLFEAPDGLPSARFFPKGVVHSIKPYGRLAPSGDARKLPPPGDGLGARNGGAAVVRRSGSKNVRKLRGGSFSDAEGVIEGSSERGFSEDSKQLSDADVSREIYGSRTGRRYNGKLKRTGNRRRFGSEPNGLKEFVSGRVGFDTVHNARTPSMRGGNSRFKRENGSLKLKDSSTEMFDMSLQQDGSYGV